MFDSVTTKVLEAAPAFTTILYVPAGGKRLIVATICVAVLLLTVISAPLNATESGVAENPAPVIVS
jgi:hypothetical protein